MKNSMAQNLTNLFLVGITMLNFTIFSFGQKIKEVEIGEQIWMSTNLNLDKFRNGDPIPEAKTAEEWKKAGDNKQPAWCYYNFDSKNGEKYGKLYNWYAVNDPRGLAPEGWHVPTDLEWTKLSNHLGGDTISGLKLKSEKGWENNGNGTNESGFNGLPSGFNANSDSFFYNIGKDGNWWSSTDGGEDYAWARYLSYNLNSIGRSYPNKDLGMSVRCLKGNLPSIGEPGDF
jgi:uncharacterized protein (TIGR02145 family)